MQKFEIETLQFEAKTLEFELETPGREMELVLAGREGEIAPLATSMASPWVVSGLVRLLGFRK